MENSLNEDKLKKIAMNFYLKQAREKNIRIFFLQITFTTKPSIWINLLQQTSYRIAGFPETIICQ